MTQVQSQTVYVYILVRKDLSPSQMAVQSCHAAIEATRAFAPGQDQEHPHIVLLGVKNEDELLKAYDKLQYYGIQIAKFQESDLNNETTAIATAPISTDSDQRRFFRNYKLLDLSVSLPVIEAEVIEQSEEPEELPECKYCEGTGEVTDPTPCGRCRVRGCRTMTCPKCNGNKTEGVSSA